MFTRDSTPKYQCRDDRSGFTMIEFLVVIGIIIILTSLLLPAIQQGRAAARRVQCKNNLRQLGLAMHNYVDVHGVLPPGYIYGSPPDGMPTTSGYGWNALLLPYLDQYALSQSADWETPIWGPDKQQFREARISVTQCASDPEVFRGYVRRPGWSSVASSQLIGGYSNEIRFAKSSYPANFGPGNMTQNPEDGRGPFTRNRSIDLAEIRDGLSHTIFCAERKSGHLTTAVKSVEAVYYETTWAGVATNLLEPEIDQARTVLFQAGHVPNSADADRYDASSPHETGIHFLMGDGSVRFSSLEIDPDLYRSLSSIDGGEMLGGESVSLDHVTAPR